MKFEIKEKPKGNGDLVITPETPAEGIAIGMIAGSLEEKGFSLGFSTSAIHIPIYKESPQEITENI